VLDGAEQLAVVGLVESAVGVVEARRLATVPGLTRLAFGALDFAADITASPDAITGQVARAEVVIASRAAGLPAPLESPSTELDAPDRVEATTRAAAALGFGGRLCIHPRQLAAVRAGFGPTEAEVGWARRVIAAAGEGAARVDGQMVDRPVVEHARRILGAAGGDQAGGRP
jgi:citrate lyase subunit beta/citryl-CoA lyase